MRRITKSDCLLCGETPPRCYHGTTGGPVHDFSHVMIETASTPYLLIEPWFPPPADSTSLSKLELMPARPVDITQRGKT